MLMLLSPTSNMIARAWRLHSLVFKSGLQSGSVFLTVQVLDLNFP